MRRVVILVSLLACGDPIAAPDDIAIPDPDRPDATISTPDASADALESGPSYNGGGPFLCADCVCDGTLRMCVHGGVGGAPTLDDAGDDAAACSDDAGQTYCAVIPIVCLPKPTCACIQSATGCACEVDPIGNGYVLDCPPPPPHP